MTSLSVDRKQKAETAATGRRNGNYSVAALEQQQHTQVREAEWNTFLDETSPPCKEYFSRQ
jgi:hypothetical protein